MCIVTLLSDYGLKGTYVAEIKGIILKIIPNATIIDITHDKSNRNPNEAAFNLARIIPYFTNNAVHLVLVNDIMAKDPVPIFIKTEKAWFVGFDNGIMIPSAEKLGIQGVYKIINSDFLPKRESDTFAGRDILAPVAALLAKGLSPSKIGSPSSKFERLEDFEPKLSPNKILSKILTIDEFGNLITNIHIDHLTKVGIKLGSILNIKNKNDTYSIPFVNAYSEVKKGDILACLCGGYLQIAVNLGNAKNKLDLKNGVNIMFEY